MCYADQHRPKISNNYNCKHRFTNKLINKKKRKASSSCFLHLHLITARLFVFSHMTLFTFYSVVYTRSSLYKRSGKIVLSLGAAIPDFLTSWNCLQPSLCNTLKPKNAKDIKAAEQRQTTSSNEKAVIICIFSEAHSARMEEGHGRKASQTE